MISADTTVACDASSDLANDGALDMNRIVIAVAAVLSTGLCGGANSADEEVHHEHHPAAQAEPAAPQAEAVNDVRQLVKYPSALRIHTLTNMRDHLQTMGEIQAALAAGSFDKASELAEARLGMSSLKMHGAHEVARFMPKGMQDAGTAMHHTASQLALIAKDASVTGDLKSVLVALSKLNQTCVACHAGYRLQ
jgi:hypothetical protein